MRDVIDRLLRALRRRPSPSRAPLDEAAPQPLTGTVAVAVAHHHKGQIAEAEACYREILAVEPSNVDVIRLSGIAKVQQGKLEEAARLFEKALQIRPDDPDLLNNLGATLKDCGEIDQAETCFRHALSANPEHCEATLNLGMLLIRRKRFEAAEDCLRRALEIRPESATPYSALGALCQQRGQLHEAEAWLREALEHAPDLAEAAANLGDVLQGLDQLDEAESWCRRALDLNPNLANALNTLGTIYRKRNLLDAAKVSYQKALLVNPHYAPASVNLGILALTCGPLDEAESYFRDAIALDPQNAIACYNLATTRLLCGDYAEGLSLYEYRFDAFVREFSASRGLHEIFPANSRWTGEPLAERHILIWMEQGLGDTLMMMRYLPLLKQRGAGKVTICCDAPLLRLMRTLPGVDAALPMDDPPRSRDIDVHCPIMSLPLMFGSRLDALSREAPYLNVPAALVERWHSRLAATRGLRVGLVWAGSKSLRDDAQRSLELRQFECLSEIPGVSLFSLQKGEAADQLRGWHAGDIIDWMEECSDLMDTAAFVANLDLVISVDTAVAHLAGALGKPVWLLNRYGSEWRWGLEGEDTPWYPTMRIFRQVERGDWSKVIDRIATCLRSA